MATIVLGCTAHAALFGCAGIYDLGEYSTSEKEPTNAAVAGDAGPAELASSDAAQGRTCATNADCAPPPASGGAPAAVCVRTTSRCAPLVTAECPRVYGDARSDDAVLLGAMLSASGGASALERAAALAASEIGASGAGGLPPLASGGKSRPLVVLGCETGAGAVRAARHLVDDLRVAAIVGPTSGEDVVELTQQVTQKAGALVMSPAAVASSLSDLADGELTWRNVPSDAQRAKLVIEQIGVIEDVLHATRGVSTVKLAVVHRRDALGTSARASIAGKLVINGRFIDDAANAALVSVDDYALASDAAAQAAIATKYADAFRPDIVFVTAPEQITSVVIPLERALTSARVAEHPYYVLTEAAKTPALLDAFTSGKLPAEVRRRVRGVGTKADTASAPVLAAFQAAYAARYGAPAAPPSAALAYDATYALALAIAAAPEASPRGPAIGEGLRALGVGTAFNVGAVDAQKALSTLVSRRSIALRGTHGLARWTASGDVATGTVEVWCVGAATGAPGFGSSGLTMDVETQVVAGAFLQCQ